MREEENACCVQGGETRVMEGANEHQIDRNGTYFFMCGRYCAVDGHVKRWKRESSLRLAGLRNNANR